MSMTADSPHRGAGVDRGIFRSDHHRIQSMPYSTTIDPALVERAAWWRRMNIIRVLLFMALNCALLLPVYRVARMLCASRLETA
jgi:hypothetical protein